jgi:hypothetical protein
MGNEVDNVQRVLAAAGSFGPGGEVRMEIHDGDDCRAAQQIELREMAPRWSFHWVRVCGHRSE